MTDLRNLTLPETEALVVRMGEAGFRAKQLFGWIYKGKTDFREMTNIPETFIAKLEAECNVGSVKILQTQISKADGTRKYLFELADGNTIESVFMKYKYGNTICLSSQAGCRMGCLFCASGKNGLARSLTAGEMVSQLLEAQRDTSEKIGHIVIMGTGEPFDNYDNLSKFITIVNDKNGLGLGMRNITVSTCGLVPMIERFAGDFPQVNLAISLHGATDEIRSSMMPINNKYPLAVLIPACRDYTRRTGRRITFEYTLVKGKNDGKAHADKLCSLLRGMLCHVNIIPLNIVEEAGLDTVNRRRAEEFRDYLESRGIPATVRRELGADIDGACGQLRMSRSK